VHDADDHLVVELSKPAGRSIELSLKGGEHQIINLRADYVLEATIVLKMGAPFELKPEMPESSEIIEDLMQRVLN